MSDESPETPHPSVSEVLACSFDSWHPIFAQHSLRARSFRLSLDFLAYLNCNGSLVLPDSAGDKQSGRRDSGSEDEDFELRMNHGGEETTTSSLRFPELDAKIEECVTDFEGAVFPKLNWSAPRDAAWINFNKSLKCMSPSDVYLLLKSSEMIAHDLQAAFRHCSDFEEGDERHKIDIHLVLKKWYDMRPEREFRCFMRSRRLVGISQRYLNGGKHRDFFVDNRSEIVDSLISFFDLEVRDKFPLSDCIFDAYWTVNGRWRIIDFNPYGAPTDPRLFTWAELMDSKLIQNGVTRPEFRFEDGNNSGIVPHEMEMYGLPIDLIDLATGNDPQKFMDLLQESVRRQRQEDASSDSED